MIQKIVKKRIKGFTLSELLIALAILGVIATFTIPKVLQSQQSTQWKSMTKETAGMVSGAFSEYQRKNTVNAAVKMSDLMPFINYVRQETTVTIDGDGVITPAVDCSDTANHTCYRMHNGGVFMMYTSLSFGGTATTNALVFGLDPDGKVTGASPGATPGQYFYLYTTGRLVTCQQAYQETACTSLGCAANAPDAPWFSWN